jgi:hypothetical protein
MQRLQAAVFWLGLVYGAVAYGMLGILFLLTPEVINGSGVVFGTAHAASAIRVGYGAPFISLAVISAFGLVRRQHAFLCLLIVAGFSLAVTLARMFAIGFDGATEHNLIELRDEGGSTIFFLLALLCGRKRNRVSYS